MLASAVCTHGEAQTRTPCTHQHDAHRQPRQRKHDDEKVRDEHLVNRLLDGAKALHARTHEFHARQRRCPSARPTKVELQRVMHWHALSITCEGALSLLGVEGAGAPLPACPLLARCLKRSRSAFSSSSEMRSAP